MRYIKNEKLLLVMIIYVFITTNLIILNSTIYTNFINPLFWVAIIIYLIADKKRNYIRISKNKKYFKYMIIIACIHFIIYIYLGMIFGFSEKINNYNFIVTIIQIIGIEITRNVIAIRNRNNKIIFILITILFILVELKYDKLVNLYPHKEAFFEYICETILPLIACNSLCTYLTLKNSVEVILIYRIIILILPNFFNVDWFIKATTGILSPTIIYVLFKYKFTSKEKSLRKNKQNFYSKVSFVITFIICINLVAFMLGIFKYEPITILSNSMRPSFERGDIVIFEKMNDSELEQIPINQIIIYSVGKQNIAHRVVDKIEQNNMVSYLTKGDNNNLLDKILVKTNQIKGKYLFHIKYIGFPTVWLYEFFNK